MTEELKLCPWCQKPPKVCPDTSYGAATVFCPDENDCPVQPVADADLKAGETVADAIARWNDRSPADAGEVREKVARALYPTMIEDGEYDSVPIDEAFERPRYAFLANRARRGADAILSLLPSPPVTDREEWRPIETAPKDGDTSFIAWGEDYGFAIVFWDPTEGKPLVCADGHQFAAEEWCWAQLDGSTLHKDCFTHWRPLLDPPPQTVG